MESYTIVFFSCRVLPYKVELSNLVSYYFYLFPSRTFLLFYLKEVILPQFSY